jgi:tetratricopeptide (TPR) repeat protein
LIRTALAVRPERGSAFTMSSGSAKPTGPGDAARAESREGPPADGSGQEGLGGPLGKPPLAALLRRISQMGFSGVLYLRRGEHRRRLYLKNSALVLATSTVPGERLGDALLSQKLCTTQLLRQVSERAKADNANVLDLLERNGTITPAQHGDLLTRMTERILFESAVWTDGEWQLVPGKLPPEVARPNQADQPIWAAMLSSYEDWRKVYEILADVQTCVVLTPDALRQSAYKELGFAAKQLLSHFSKERSVHQIARGRILNRFEELLTLARCVELGLLKVTRLARPEETRPSDGAEPESTLPLQRGAAAAAAEAVSAVLKPENAPALKPLSLSAPQTSQDFEELRRRRQRAAELKQLAAEQNKVGGDLQKGLELLQEAMQLDPEAVELPLTAAEMLLRNPRRVDDAAAYCRKALALQPESGRAHLLLGKLSVTLRDLEQARREFELTRGTGEEAEGLRLLATLTKQASPRPAAALAPGPNLAQATKAGAASGSRRSAQPAVRQRPLARLLVVLLLGVWAYGLLQFVLWRVDAGFGPRPARTVDNASHP